MIRNFQRFWAMLFTIILLSTLTVALVVQSSLRQNKPRFTPARRTSFLKTNTQSAGRFVNDVVLMAKSPKGDDGSKENPLSKLLSRFRTPELFPEEIVELDEEIEKALWFDPKPFLKNVSLPNIFFGSVLGAVIAFATIFAPFFLPDDLAFPSGAAISNAAELSTSSKAQTIKENVLLFEDILEDLQAGYVDPVNPTKLFETAVSAMLKSLDPYTEFENLGAAKNMLESVSGKYGGVGLIISGSKEKNVPVAIPAGTTAAEKMAPKQDLDADTAKGNKGIPKLPSFGVTVVDAFEGYGYDAGLRVGDRLVSVGGVDATKMNVEQVRDLLRGDPDTDIKIVFDREESTFFIKKQLPSLKDSKPSESASDMITLGAIPSVPTVSPDSATSVRQEITIKRQLVRMSDIRLATFIGDPQDGIGYINLSGFNSGAGRDFRQAMVMLRYSSPVDLKGLVLDLRGNPGGLLDAAVEIASYLVPSKSDIVSAKSRNGEEVIYRSVIDPIRPPGMKLAVMVNSGSASASEIVSGAVQDLDAGIIVGPSKTYGKGLVQKITPLPYDNALKYTIAKYYTPSGRCIQSVTYTGGRDLIVSSAEVTDKKTGDDEIAPKVKEEDKGEDKKKETLNKEGLKIKDGNTKGVDPYKDIDQRFMESKINNIENEPSNLLAVLTKAAKGNQYSDSDSVQNRDYNFNDIPESTNKIVSYDDRPKKNPKIPEIKKNAYSADGAYEIADVDRKTFFTKAGRPVKDGGGIEVDIKTEPLIPGPAETIFLTQGVYFDFASEFLTTHNIRPILREVAAAEKAARDSDERMLTGLRGGSINQYLVLVEPALGTLDSDSKSENMQLTAQSTKSIPLSSFGSAYSDSDSKGSIIPPSSAQFTSSKSSSKYDQKIEDLFWVNVDGASNGAGKTKNVYNSAADRRKDFYESFRKYVEARIEKGEINVEAGLGPKFDSLEKDLKGEGLTAMVDKIEILRKSIAENILADMNKNRDQIVDDIEITILSRELPDRLLLFRNIVHDPQVGAAVSVLRDSIRHSDAFSNAVHDACVIPGKADDLIATCINDKLVTGSGVVDQYDTLLAGPNQPPQ